MCFRPSTSDGDSHNVRMQAICKLSDVFMQRVSVPVDHLSKQIVQSKLADGAMGFTIGLHE